MPQFGLSLSKSLDISTTFPYYLIMVDNLNFALASIGSFFFLVLVVGFFVAGIISFLKK